jgi:hypothetical protein
MKQKNTEICWRCRWLVTNLGFLHRNKKQGPCDKCLDKVTTMQQLMENKIWLKYIPKKEKRNKDNNKREDKNPK